MHGESRLRIAGTSKPQRRSGFARRTTRARAKGNALRLSDAATTLACDAQMNGLREAFDLETERNGPWPMCGEAIRQEENARGRLFRGERESTYRALVDAASTRTFRSLVGSLCDGHERKGARGEDLHAHPREGLAWGTHDEEPRGIDARGEHLGGMELWSVCRLNPCTMHMRASFLGGADRSQGDGGASSVRVRCCDFGHATWEPEVRQDSGQLGPFEIEQMGWIDRKGTGILSKMNA